MPIRQLSLLAALLLASPAPAGGVDLGPNVLVIDGSTPDAQSKIDAVFAEQERAQFGPGRHAILFMPGSYSLNVRVGFYTQVAGLGASPDDVVIGGAVKSTAEWMRGNATCNFWRCVENLTIAPTQGASVWAVSQGAAMRRVHVKGDLNLSDGGWSSGGFLAECVIDGRVDSGTQQQWFSRNCAWGSWTGGNWNMVFVGVTNPPVGEWPQHPYTVIDRTPVIREKPYLTVGHGGSFAVVNPPLRSEAAAGAAWKAGSPEGARVPIERFHIARPEKDTAATLNSALAAGRELLFTPGIYRLGETLRITRPGTIVLGLGYPTLVAEKGNALITAADVDGVRIAGLLLEAGAQRSRVLIELGEAGKSADHGKDPAVLQDLYCRAGGAAAGSADTFAEIHSGHVIGDNLWLWRADHGAGAAWEENRNAHGLVVNGADVTIYGLFVEHGQDYQTVWNGERGRVYFYQSEMPYDPPSMEAWMNGTRRGFASYKVGEGVKDHRAWGLGVYCVFWHAPVIAESAIEAPETPGVQLRHLVAVRLNGKPGSGINHVLNKLGEPVLKPESKISRLK